MKRVFWGLAVLLMSLPSHAERFWTNDLQDWTFALNNGVAYVMSDSYPAECQYSRAQLNFNGSEYNSAMFSYILAASKAKDKLRVVLDHDRSAADNTITCVIYAAAVD